MSINLRDGLLGQSVDHVLEDLLVRFVINVPDEDLSSIERVFFQVEEAQWFYTDFLRTLNPELPSMKMKSFAPKILNKCPLLWKWGDPADALPRFGKYKSTIPVRGIAMLNKDLSKLVLLKGLESNTWSFPRGKISKGEADLECAIRETREETGFDAREYVSENAVLERTIYGKNFKIYLAKGVPEDHVFEPLVRNEIAEIRWFDIKNLLKLVKNSPNKYFVVNTLLKPLTKWINGNKGLVSDEQLMRDAEIKLKALMGITPSAQANADAGRELLDILQGAKPQTPLSNVPVGGLPVPQLQQQFIQMSLPQHLQSVYSGFAHMPQFFSPYTQGLNHTSVVSPPEFIPPHFENAKPQVHTSASLPTNAQALTNSKELLSILKGTTTPKNTGVPDVSPPLNNLQDKSSPAEELLLILKKSKPKPKATQKLPADPPVTTSRPDTPSKKITLLKRDKTASESNASATLLGILGKKPHTTETNVPQSEEKPNKLASAELLGILNKSKTGELSGDNCMKLQLESSETSSSSAELLNILHAKNHIPISKEEANGDTPHISEQKPIRLAKRSEEVPADLKSFFQGESQPGSEPSSQPATDLSAGNQILRLIGKDTEANNSKAPRSGQENDENFDDFDDFENFENFDDFEDIQGPPSHIYDLINKTLDAQMDEEDMFEDAHSHMLPVESQTAPAEFLPITHENKTAPNHLSAYQNTYGFPDVGINKSVSTPQPKRAPSTNGADILLLLRRN
ncbi:DCP2-domain-containing protein [Metschnikowia bicuspidata var. bicuspidata NRRL YB-4993]|uniref:DCP2-domain-containing protein n=1 Tax=Metschnikowia bicuspidata var. bicuspidata NRRL YB-4993 TaxID=869754 RepID=A0A1A0H798_9ASCO|nr:DCP2-domain-containing protein [Metschnikowia bicuspidata var. bicuspidata NRRL YB-4993]OBA19901.1 DCP2-domain-containing protein [Metschnikowia bicuspidata var. bicuspidata NRRL YB-4993]